MHLDTGSGISEGQMNGELEPIWVCNYIRDTEGSRLASSQDEANWHRMAQLKRVRGIAALTPHIDPFQSFQSITMTG
jgi:hypothetical protein